MYSVLLILVAISHGGQDAKRQRCQKRLILSAFDARQHSSVVRKADCLNGHRDCSWVQNDIRSKTCDLWEWGAVLTSLKDYPRTESLH